MHTLKKPCQESLWHFKLTNKCMYMNKFNICVHSPTLLIWRCISSLLWKHLITFEWIQFWLLSNFMLQCYKLAWAVLDRHSAGHLGLERDEWEQAGFKLLLIRSCWHLLDLPSTCTTWCKIICSDWRTVISAVTDSWYFAVTFTQFQITHTWNRVNNLGTHFYPLRKEVHSISN